MTSSGVAEPRQTSTIRRRFRSAIPSRVAWFSVGANTPRTAPNYVPATVEGMPILATVWARAAWDNAGVKSRVRRLGAIDIDCLQRVVQHYRNGKPVARSSHSARQRASKRSKLTSSSSLRTLSSSTVRATRRKD